MVKRKGYGRKETRNLIYTNKFRNNIVFIQCAILGIGIFTLFVVYFKGNALVMAGPMGLWAAVVSLPVIKDRNAKLKSRKSRRNRKHVEAKSRKIPIRFILIVFVWVTVVLVLWPKLAEPTLSDDNLIEEINKAEILFQKGQLEDALIAYEKLEIPEYLPLRLAQKYHNIGIISLQLKQTDNAEQALKKALLYDAQDSEACYFLGVIAFQDKRYGEAQVWLKRAQKLNPNRKDLAGLLQAVEDILRDKV